jgi:hypothetical protein
VKSRRSVLAVAVVAALAGSALVIAPAVAQAPKKNVKIKLLGGITVKPGKFIKDDQRFGPRTKTVRSGGTVRIVYRATAPDPHTISFVRRSQLPKTAQETFECAACGPFFGAHEANEETGEVGKPVVDVGRPGVDQAGDSIYIPPEQGIRFDVSAPAGTNLSYLCAIHPWMQGKLRVR